MENAQFIQVEKLPYWQVSGLNIDGSQLTLIQDNKFGLLDGNLEVSANAASIDKLIATQAHLKAHADNNLLTLDRAFVPLEQGYIEASGRWDRSSASSPWQVSLHADGLPLQHYLLEQQLPFSLTGLAEVEVELKGLSGDYSMLSHSLSGYISANLHQAQLNASSFDGEQSFEQDFDLGEIKLRADRGRILIAAQEGTTQLAGEADLTKPQFATLLLKSEQTCQELWSDILGKANVIKQTCGEKSPQSPQASDAQESAVASGPSTAL